MNKLFALAAVAGLALSTAVVAEEAKAPEAAAPAATAEAAAPAVTTLELKDGTKAEVAGEAVSVVNADGTKTPAPDGTHELKDGTTVTTKDGKVVK